MTNSQNNGMTSKPGIWYLLQIPYFKLDRNIYLFHINSLDSENIGLCSKNLKPLKALGGKNNLPKNKQNNPTELLCLCSLPNNSLTLVHIKKILIIF